MAWLATDLNGTEYLHYSQPYRHGASWDNYDGVMLELPQGSVERLIGRELTWADKPVELTQETLIPKS